MARKFEMGRGMTIRLKFKEGADTAEMNLEERVVPRK